LQKNYQATQTCLHLPLQEKPSFLSVVSVTVVCLNGTDLHSASEKLNEACSGPQRLGARFRGGPELQILYNVLQKQFITALSN
jgi:hypothetical protein